jgi:hypothetical protein
MVSKKLCEMYWAQKHCSLANTCMPKANTSDFPACNPSLRSYCEFNKLRAPAGLA